MSGMFDTGHGTFAGLNGGPVGLTGTASLCIVLLSAKETEATMRTRLTLAAVLAAAGTTEASFTNYARIFVTTGVTNTIASHITTLTMPNQVWMNAGPGVNPTVVTLLVCYKPSSSATDAQITPYGSYDFAITTDGSNLTAQVDAVNGLMQAA